MMCILTLDLACNLIKKATDWYASRGPFGYLTKPIFMAILCWAIVLPIHRGN